MLPAGAEIHSRDPSVGDELDGGPATYPPTLELVEAYRFWRLRGTPQMILAWLKTHPPNGSTLIESGASAGETTSREAIFSLPAQPGETNLEWLEIYEVPARGGGTALRASAVVEWVRPRPKGERLPDGVRSVEVTLHDPERHLSVTRTLHAPMTLKRMIALIEGLQRAPRSYGTRSQCGAARFSPAYVHLVFRGANGAVLARVVTTQCGSTEIWLHGRRQPKLSGEVTVIDRIAAVLHLRAAAD